ncbi:MAG: HAD family hydrolase [archaeon]|nr:HAD family hydrolase [archaeon]
MIKVVIFDIGDTLFLNNKALLKTIKAAPELKGLKSFGYDFSKKDYDKARFKSEEFYAALSDNKKLQHMVFDLLMLKAFGIKQSKKIAKEMDNHFRKEYLKNLKIMPNAKSLLSYLKKQRVVLCIITNANTDFGKDMVKKFKINHYFKHLLISYQLGYQKRKIEPFHILLKILNKNRKQKIKSNECLMVGNNVKEDAAAKHAGMKVAILTTQMYFKELIKEMKPDYLIKDLMEVKKIVEENQ